MGGRDSAGLCVKYQQCPPQCAGVTRAQPSPLRPSREIPPQPGHLHPPCSEEWPPCREPSPHGEPRPPKTSRPSAGLYTPPRCRSAPRNPSQSAPAGTGRCRGAHHVFTPRTHVNPSHTHTLGSLAAWHVAPVCPGSEGSHQPGRARRLSPARRAERTTSERSDPPACWVRGDGQGDAEGA